MDIQRSIPIVIAPNVDILATVNEFNRFQKEISETAFNPSGRHLTALKLHKEVYHTTPSTLTSQLKCSAIRRTAGAYASAASNRQPAKKPFIFRKKSALFLIGKKPLMEARSERRAFATGRKVSSPEIGDRRDSGAARDYVGIADLHCERSFTAWAVSYRLSMTANRPDPR